MDGGKEGPTKDNILAWKSSDSSSFSRMRRSGGRMRAISAACARAASTSLHSLRGWRRGVGVGASVRGRRQRTSQGGKKG